MKLFLKGVILTGVMIFLASSCSSTKKVSFNKFVVKEYVEVVTEMEEEAFINMVAGSKMGKNGESVRSFDRPIMQIYSVAQSPRITGFWVNFTADEIYSWENNEVTGWKDAFGIDKITGFKAIVQVGHELKSKPEGKDFLCFGSLHAPRSFQMKGEKPFMVPVFYCQYFYMDGWAYFSKEKDAVLKSVDYEED